MADDTDYSDPCAVLAKLRPAYYALVAGEKVAKVEMTTGNGTSKSVAYQKTDLAWLKAEIGRLESACKAKQTGRPAVSAVVAGGVVPYPTRVFR